jgi:hypothetical protein
MTMMETHKQNGESLFQLSADEILAVQEMRRTAREIGNAKAHLGDLGWHLSSLTELEA